MPADVNERRFPSAEDEARFWALAGAAWARCSAEANRVRRALAARAPGPDAGLFAVDGALPEFPGTLADQCRELPGGELTSLDRVLERKLCDIGRSDIQAVVTGGSDDGFLDARGFIVAMGRDSCHAVAGDPQVAVPDAGCEEMCYFLAHLHRERFRGFPGDGRGDFPRIMFRRGRLGQLTPPRATARIAPCRIRAAAGRPPTGGGSWKPPRRGPG
jgi:hypothetical protein